MSASHPEILGHVSSKIYLSRSDFVYMVPPFLAYYGLLTNNQSLITDAYTQIKLYRNYLRDTSAGNLWAHIVLGNNSNGVANDPGHWSTGTFFLST